MSERTSFVFHREWVDAVKNLPKDFKLDIYEAIIEYALSGTMPKDLKPVAELGFTLVKSRIDFDRERHEKVASARAEAGRKSGEARRTKRTNVNFVEQTLNKNEQTSNKREHIYDICTMSTEKETLSNERAKKKYGERIAMTEEEYDKLVEQFGKELVTEEVQCADDWLLSKGKTQKDYAAFMRNWLKRASAKKRTSSKVLPVSRIQSPDLNKSAKDLATRGVKFIDCSRKTSPVSALNQKHEQAVVLDDTPPF